MTDRERNAFSRAIHSGLAAKVTRRAYGHYLVPSSSLNITYTVYTDEYGLLRCSCPSGAHGKPCRHVCAVIIRRTQEQALKQAQRRRVAA